LAAVAIGLALARPASLGLGLGRTQGQVLDGRVLAAIEGELERGPVEWAYMDNLTYAAAYGLRTPPELAVASAKRRRNGAFTDATIAEALEGRGVELVLLERFGYGRKSPVGALLRARYEEVGTFGEARVYRLRRE
jgi:hypothetical protein